MLKDIIIGQYIPGDSFIHELDSRVKSILSVFFVIGVFFVNGFMGYLFTIIFILLVIYISKLKFKYIYKGLKPIVILLMFTGVFNMFQGSTLWFHYGIIRIYKEGVYTGVLMIIRLVILIVGTSILTLTTSPIELTDGIEKLLGPFKRIGLPAHELAMMMTIALRFIPTLIDETDKIMKAQMARGADFETGNIFVRAKNLIPLLVPLFISAFRRADELAMAMEARCYRGGEGRTRMKQLSMSYRDTIAIIVFIVYLILSISCGWWLKL